MIHTRRPEAWANLSETDAALLDFLRQRGKSSELSPDDTIRRALALRPNKAVSSALLKWRIPNRHGFAPCWARSASSLERIRRRCGDCRASLNPFSRFDFGMLTGLRHAREWQAKERRT